MLSRFQKFVANFSLFRSVVWVGVITFLLANYLDGELKIVERIQTFEKIIYFKEIRDDSMKKYCSVAYQFYALFSIFAYVQLLEGIKHVNLYLRVLVTRLYFFHFSVQPLRDDLFPG